MNTTANNTHNDMNNLDNAKLIGDTYTKVGVKYNSDDNTWTEYTYEQVSLACPVNIKSQLTCARIGNLFTEMFGS